MGSNRFAIAAKKTASLAKKHLGPAQRDLIWAGAMFVGISIALVAVDFFEWIFEFTRDHEDLELDEWIAAVPALALAGAWFSWRRWQQIAATERELAALEAQRTDALENISEGFALWDENDRLLLCNNKYRNLYPDLSDVTVPGVHFNDFARAGYERGVFERDGMKLDTAIARRLERHRQATSTFEHELSDGRWVRVSKRRTKAGSVVSILTDITHLVEADEKIRQMAMEDPMTGLPNRAQFHIQLESALANADRAGSKVGVMLLDLDHFKKVNDTLGHAVGDKLLQQVGKRITESVRKTDLVARLGGDEFAVITVNAQLFGGVHRVGTAIIEALSAPFIIDGKTVHTGTSVGATIYPDDPGEAGELLRNADVALYQAKDEGRGSCHLFDEKLDIAMQERTALERDLRTAVAQEQLFLVFQPQIDLRTGAVIGAESLVRWQHPERGLVGPNEFIPVAEATGQIVDINRWVIRRACEQMVTWIDAGTAPPRLSVNISPVLFRQQDFFADLRQALDETGLDPRRLEIEITESVAMAAGDDAERVLFELRAVGVQLAIDDFGTGYSSLNRLKQFPLDRLKIDRSFVSNITTNEDDAAISRAITEMGHALDMKVIAEGAETSAQVEFLTKLGCDEVQGYFYSKPLPADELVEFIATYRPAHSVAKQRVV